MQRTITIASLSLAAACGASAPGPEPIGNRAAGTTAGRVECPSGEALDAVARRAWNAGEAAKVSATCVAAAAGEPLWIVDGYVEREDADTSFIDMHTAIVTPDGTVRSLESNTEMPYGAIMRSSASYEAIDFDGDGRDELLLETAYSHGGFDESHLFLVTIDAKGTMQRAEQDDGIALGADNTAADADPAEVYSCNATRRIIDRPGGGKLLEVVGDAGSSGAGGAACANAGRHVYAMSAGKLVEVKDR